MHTPDPQIPDPDAMPADDVLQEPSTEKEPGEEPKPSDAEGARETDAGGSADANAPRDDEVPGAGGGTDDEPDAAHERDPEADEPSHDAVGIGVIDTEEPTD